MDNQEYIFKETLEAWERGCEKARKVAIETNTYLVYERNGKIVNIHPITNEVVPDENLET
jgi:hypothetical protein